MTFFLTGSGPSQITPSKHTFQPAAWRQQKPKSHFLSFLIYAPQRLKNKLRNLAGWREVACVKITPRAFPCTPSVNTGNITDKAGPTLAPCQGHLNRPYEVPLLKSHKSQTLPFSSYDPLACQGPAAFRNAEALRLR